MTLSLRRCSCAALLLSWAWTSAQAGCPALPEERATIQISSCRYYDAASDKAFKTSVSRHFSQDRMDLSSPRLRQLRRDALERNTGAILRGQIANVAGEEEYFYQSGDRDICARFAPRQTFAVSIRTTCPMVLFEAPTPKVLTLTSDPVAQ